MADKYVTTGEKANIFHDQATGITVVKGDILRLNPNQLNSRRVKQAIASGHLVYTTPKDGETKSESTIDESVVKKNKDLFVNMYKSGSTIAKLEKAFSIDVLKNIANLYNLKPEDNDTKQDIVKAIIEEISNEGKK